MKTFIVFIVLLAGLNYTNAQDKTTKEKKSVRISFEVKGVCNMCKERIETAAIYTKGVKFASWNKDSQEITVVYNPKNTTAETIHQNIANAGHDTASAKASSEVYSKLPDCCLYRDGVEIH
jgi:periplasmic mercuric ion binding protein